MLHEELPLHTHPPDGDVLSSGHVRFSSLPLGYVSSDGIRLHREHGNYTSSMDNLDTIGIDVKLQTAVGQARRLTKYFFNFAEAQALGNRVHDDGRCRHMSDDVS
jgi:hypothetical protein